MANTYQQYCSTYTEMRHSQMIRSLLNSAEFYWYFTNAEKSYFEDELEATSWSRDRAYMESPSIDAISFQDQRARAHHHCNQMIRHCEQFTARTDFSFCGAWPGGVKWMTAEHLFLHRAHSARRCAAGKSGSEENEEVLASTVEDFLSYSSLLKAF